MRWTQPQQPWTRFLVTGALLSLTLVAFFVYDRQFSTHASKYAAKSVFQSHSCATATDQSHGSSSSSNSGNGSSSAGWEFDVTVDGDNHGLSEEQCRLAFPKLFVEIEKAAALRAERPITSEEVEGMEVEEGMVRGIIEGGELYIVNYAAMPVTFSRGKATLHSLQRALASFPDRHALPSIEFVLTTEDFSTGKDPIWSYSKRDEDENVWLMPDFGYWSWPEVKIGPYKDIRRRIAEVDDGTTAPDGTVLTRGTPFADKKKQLVWRGSVATNPEIRGKLVRQAQGRSWASVRVIDWDDENDVRFNLLPMEEHCRYMFLAHTEGRSFSGRGKYLLNCRSVVIAHSLVWREAHHAAMIATGPDANYVEVSRDFSDLDRKVEYLIDNPTVAARIAENAVRTFRDRYLTPAAESCYWRALVRSYATACDFVPVLETVRDGRREMRGTPFESWVLSS